MASRHACLHLLLAAACLTPLQSARAYNSEEHKVVANMGAAAVVVPPSVTFPVNTGYAQIPVASHQDVYKAAKRLAVGFSTNNPADYSDQTKLTQDNSYWYNYAQREGNLNIWIPPTQYLRENTLLVQGRTHADVRQFQFGELVALYGDYRKTTYCDGNGHCYLTQGTVWTLTFNYGQDCFGVWPFQECGYRPNPMDMALYLRYIASGIWPPYGTAGNTFQNTAYEDEWNDAGWWGDEMIRIANINDWHFSRGALAWYIGLHRIALTYVDLARSNPAMWNVALHYEANALHSLTDLFCFGHIVTNRDETSYGIMDGDNLLNYVSYLGQQHILAQGGATRESAGRFALSSNLPPVSDGSRARNDFQPSYRPAAWNLWAKWEHDYHDYFNNGGAQVRNLRGETFTIYGDGRLRSSSDQTKGIIANSVTASLQSLFNAYVELEAGSRTVEEIAASGSSYFAALKHIPVFVESNPDHYFDGMWTRYAEHADAVSGAGVMPVNSNFCTMPYMNGGSPWPDVQAGPCMAFPVVASVGDDVGVLPAQMELTQNVPNPFNPTTVIEYSAVSPGHVRLDIYNMLGQRVRTLVDAVRPAGVYSLQWDGRDDVGHELPSAVYLYQLSTETGRQVKRMTLLR